MQWEKISERETYFFKQSNTALITSSSFERLQFSVISIVLLYFTYYIIIYDEKWRVFVLDRYKLILYILLLSPPQKFQVVFVMGSSKPVFSRTGDRYSHKSSILYLVRYLLIAVVLYYYLYRIAVNYLWEQ